MPVISRSFTASRVKDPLFLPPPLSPPPPPPPPPPPSPPRYSLRHHRNPTATASAAISSAYQHQKPTILDCLIRFLFDLPRCLRPAVQMWHNPVSHINTTFLFLDRPVPNSSSFPTLPPIIIPQNSSYLTAGHRITRIVKDSFALNIPDILWYVFGDDDTIFFTDNLVKILSKYDHSRWYYIGCSSEIYELNEKFSFEMAFGGGDYAISAPFGSGLAWGSRFLP